MLQKFTRMLLWLSLVALLALTPGQTVNAQAQGSGKNYKGSVTLKRTCADQDNNRNEFARFTNVTLTNTSDAPEKASWMTTADVEVTTSADNKNKTNPTISAAASTSKMKAGIVLLFNRTKKTYTLTVGPMKIPATILADGNTFHDVWTIDGETASEVPLPAGASQLKGSKVIRETDGSSVELSWDLQL